jgi:membrane protein
MKSLLNRAKTAFQARRDAWGWFDHLIRAGQRYKADHGDRLAASLTMYLILALLPLMLVAMSVLGYVLANNPDAQAKIFAKVTDIIPGIGSQLSEGLTNVEQSRGTIGLIGLLGLVFSGLGGIDALRDALRLMWHHDTDAGNYFKKKLSDVVTVGVLAGTLAVSLGISALATGGAGALLEASGVEGAFAKGITSVLSFVIGVGIDAVLFLVLFKWLPRVDWPLRRLVRGAVFGGVAFGLLKIAGAEYVARTATRSSALYGSIGTAVAVLVGLYLVSRVILFTAAWTVTAPGWDDVEPSGTASKEAAREANIPLAAVDAAPHEHAGHRLDPVQQAKDEQGGPAPGGEREPARARELVGAGVAAAAGARAVAARSGQEAAWGGSPEARDNAVLAAKAVQGAGAMLVAFLGVQGIRSLRRD